jgi:PAS domain S-box-containing protein
MARKIRPQKPKTVSLPTEAGRVMQIQGRLVARLSGTSGLTAGLRLCLAAAMEISGLDSGGIYIPAPRARGLVLKVHRGLSPAFVRRQRIVPPESPFLAPIRQGKTVSTHGERMFPKFVFSETSPERRERLRAVAGIPVMSEGKVIACMNLASHKHNAISLSILRTLEAVAGQVGLALMRLRAEESVRQSEAKYRKLIDDAGDAIFLVDVETGAIIEANHRAAALTGRSLRELLGRHFTFLHPPRQAEQYRGFFAEHVARRSAVLADGAVQHKSGRVVPVEIASSLIEWRGRRMQQGIFRDLTERRDAERAQKRSHAALRRLAAEQSETQENERRRIARELHDEVGQTIAGLALSLNQLLNALPPGHDDALRGRLSAHVRLLEETTGRIRSVISDLRPPLLDEFGLSAALHHYAKDFSARADIPVRVWIDEDLPRLRPIAENALFRIAQEALANAHKHAGAATIVLTLEADARAFHLLVRDDGAGFDEARAGATSRQPHWGLSIMKERAGGVGGRCRIVSAPGAGTQVIVEVPR